MNEYVNFLKQVHPFDELDELTLEEITTHLDVLYFDTGTKVITKGEYPEYLYLIIKGVVHKMEGSEVIDTYIKLDTFSSVSLIKKSAKHDFVVDKELICYGLKREKFLELFDNNDAFERYFFQNISSKLEKLNQQKHNQQLSGFMVSRVKELGFKLRYIDATTSIYDTVLKMKAEHLASILVKRGEEFGIVTDSNIKNGVILEGIRPEEPIEKLAIFELHTIDENDFLFNALLKMIDKSVKRLIVTKDNQVVSILEQMDLLSYFSNHSQMVVSKIQQAHSLEELKKPSFMVLNIVKALEAKGVKIRYIAKLIAQIHTKIFHKLYEMTFDEEFIHHSALIVMGSEGRAEQILRTDQDLGIIIDDGFSYKEYSAQFQAYTDALIELGFPKCEGNIMTSNPYWVKHKIEYKESIYDWIYNSTLEKSIHIATFADARCVAGDAHLLEDTKHYFFELISGHHNFLMGFASIALNFETPLGLFTNFIIDKSSKGLDIKKGGIFAIVQGVRALALEQNIHATNTVERLKELNNRAVLDKEFTKELIESYELLLKLRLRYRLLALSRGDKPSNNITPLTLSKLEQDLLKDAFKSVKTLKKILSHHFKLSYVT